MISRRMATAEASKGSTRSFLAFKGLLDTLSAFPFPFSLISFPFSKIFLSFFLCFSDGLSFAVVSVFSVGVLLSTFIGSSWVRQLVSPTLNSYHNYRYPKRAIDKKSYFQFLRNKNKFIDIRQKVKLQII